MAVPEPGEIWQAKGTPAITVRVDSVDDEDIDWTILTGADGEPYIPGEDMAPAERHGTLHAVTDAGRRAPGFLDGFEPG